MNCQEVWENACKLLKAEMTAISYKTWIIGSLKPKWIQDDQFYLEIGGGLPRSMLARYASLIANAVSAAADQKLTVQYLTPEEAAAMKPAPTVGSETTTTAPQLNPRYTFDTFVVGSSNRFAQAAALAVAETPADAYNPLFIYGGVGLGKTHLMHAIGHYIQQQYPSMRLLYISSESFTNQLISAIQRNTTAAFRDRYRNVDVLMIDDIQFIAGKDSTQEEFFHTFNALKEAGKQIVISSDKPPKAIARLEERLRSRFEWGMVADVQQPDIETRNAILRKKAETDGLEIEDDVIQLIAERVDSNIRELEGSLTRVVAYAKLAGKPVTVSLIEESLKDAFTAKDPKRITCALIQEAVAEYCAVNIEDLKSTKRNRSITVPRQIAMFLTREMTEMSLPRIGDAFGGRDHSTVIHACDKIALEVGSNPTLKTTVDDLRKAISEK